MRGLLAQMIAQSSCGPRLDKSFGLFHLIISLLLHVSWLISASSCFEQLSFCPLTPFCPYHMILQEHGSVVKAIYSGSEYITNASGDEDVGIVLESTSFYAEQGGQVYLSQWTMQC